MDLHWLGRRLWRRLGTTALAVAIAFSPLAHALGAERSRHAVLVIDANTGRVLHQRAADAPRFPASLVKLMTLFIVFEQIEEGRLSRTTKVRFSANAVAQPPSKLDVEEGTEIALIDAVKALIVKSANDVAVAVAEHIAGSEEKFAALMNRKALELGMTATQFRNASGLPDGGQVTTARDMITLALRLHDQFPKYYPLFATRTFTWGGDTYRNHNTLLFRYQGLDGMKTGYIRASGFNLVASARRGRKHVLAAYFGGKTAGRRNAAVRAHLDAAFAKASENKTRRPAPLVVAQPKAAPAPPADVRPAAEQAETAPAVAATTIPAPQPASRPSLAATSGIELMRVRPVPAGGAAPQSESADAPTDIADLLQQAEAPPASAPRDAAAESAAGPAAVTESVGAPTGPFQVQVGAYHTEGEAERQLTMVRQRAGAVLGAHAAHMSQVKHGEKVFFRARYVGFEAHAAAAGVCSELKRLDIDCFVMRAE